MPTKADPSRKKPTASNTKADGSKRKTTQTQAKRIARVKRDALKTTDATGEEFDLNLLPTVAFAGKTKITPADKRYLRAAAENMLSLGYSIREIASALKIPYSTVAFWNGKIDEKKRLEIEDRIAKTVTKEMAVFVATALRSMGQVAQYCSSESYLDKHPPDKVSQLFDVIGNRAFQLVESQQRAQMAANRARAEYRPTAPEGQTEPDDEALASHVTQDASSATDDASSRTADAQPAEIVVNAEQGDDSNVRTEATSQSDSLA